MARLNKDDLAQMNEDYFKSLAQERLVEVAKNLHELAVEQWEKINSNSRNSSQPPSSDNPFQKADGSFTSTSDSSENSSDATKSEKKNIAIEQPVKDSVSKLEVLNAVR